MDIKSIPTTNISISKEDYNENGLNKSIHVRKIYNGFIVSIDIHGKVSNELGGVEYTNKHIEVYVKEDPTKNKEFNKIVNKGTKKLLDSFKIDDLA